VNPFSLLIVAGDLHKSVCGIKLLAELNDALQIIVEELLRLEVELVLAERLLVSLDHHEDDLLVLVRALEEVLQVTLLLDLILRLFNVINIVHLILRSFCRLFQFFVQVRQVLVIVHVLLLGLALMEYLVVILFALPFGRVLSIFLLGRLDGLRLILLLFLILLLLFQVLLLILLLLLFLWLLLLLQHLH